MKTYKIYSAGVFVETEKQFEVLNSFDNSLIAKTFMADKELVESSIRSAKAVEKELAVMPSYKRYAILMDIAMSLEAAKDQLAALLAAEAAKPLVYALGEVDRSIQTFKVAAEEAKRLPSEYLSIDWTPAGKGKEGLVKYFPVGLVAGITPFNFPLNLAVHKIAPAIASGCPIVLKPATSTPLSTLFLAQIIDKTDLPKGALSVLPMDRATGNILVSDERFKLLSFTGSPFVGWKMKADAGKKKVVLELGGNAGVIVSKDADLDLAVKKCVVGGFSYSGQVCIHTQRIYVEDAIFDAFVERFVEASANLKMGAPNELSTEISAMIDEKNAIRVDDWVKEALKDGAELLCGGNRDGAYYEPTILTNTKFEMKVCSDEIFGPVVVLERFNDFDQALKMVNEGEFGLQAGVFTDSIKEMNKAFSELEVGGVIVNDVPTFRVDHMPYGGVKESGIGREGVKYAITEMMEAKILVKDA